MAIDDCALTLTAVDGAVERIDRTLLRRGARTSGTVHRTDRPDWRLVAVAVPPWVARLPDVGRLSPLALRIYAAAIGTGVAVVVGLASFGDDMLALAAPLVPSRVSQPVGDAVIASLGAPRCTDPTGLAALARLVARLKPAGDFVEPVSVEVVDTAAVNAVTAPGGRIAIFRGLIDRAVGADEVAGVLAHELSHVTLRHPTKALLRQMGVSLIARALGGDVGNVADLAGLLRSSRRAETAADAGAVDLLRAAHVSPAGLATFFLRLDTDDRRKPRDAVGRVVDVAADYGATHPGLRDRQATIAAALPRAGRVTPALDATDWTALRAICRATTP